MALSDPDPVRRLQRKLAALSATLSATVDYILREDENLSAEMRRTSHPNAEKPWPQSDAAR
jgi:hypothetical protein